VIPIQPIPIQPIQPIQPIYPIAPAPVCPNQQCQSQPERIIERVEMPPINNIINNNNTVHAPTNITTSNVNTIHISMGSNGCKKGTKTVSTGEGANSVVNVECIEDEKEESENVETETVEPKENCCTIIGPRQCRRQDGEWQCFHRKHHRCGDFCTKDTIYLRPRRPTYRQQTLVMPPYQPARPYAPAGRLGIVDQIMFSLAYISNWANFFFTLRLDCSSCLRSYSRCPSTCYQYDCASSDCGYMDQSSFCENYGGGGCGRDDGCLDGTGCF
jgi:hypothetical protein